MIIQVNITNTTKELDKTDEPKFENDVFTFTSAKCKSYKKLTANIDIHNYGRRVSLKNSQSQNRIYVFTKKKLILKKSICIRRKKRGNVKITTMS